MTKPHLIVARKRAGKRKSDQPEVPITSLEAARKALQMGGNIRICFENNTLLPDGSPADNNVQTVALAAALIKDMTDE